MNKDLILREKLAIERTELANQSTFLAFIRTSLYFFLAGFSIDNLLKINYNYIDLLLYVISCVIFAFGVFNFLIHKTKISKAKESIGGVKLEYLNH